jgi:TPR repeat protein
MTRNELKSKKLREANAEELYRRADWEQGSGNLLSGFRLLLAAAKLGSESAQLNLGYTYDVGIGVRRNRSAAMYWYKKAYRSGKGWGCAASNIGTIYRDERRYSLAKLWFQRATDYGDLDACLELAKIYLQQPAERGKAVDCLKKVLDGHPPIMVGEDTQDEARALLQTIRGS